MPRCAPAFSNATPPTVRTALTISRPQNCGAVLGHTCNRIDREPNSPLRAGAYWSVYELTHRAPGSRRAAGSRSARTESPRICWHTIFICGKPQWYGKPLKQLGLLSRQAHIRRVTGRIAAIGIASRGFRVRVSNSRKAGRLTEASTDRRSHELTDCVAGHHVIEGGPGRGI